MYERKYKSRAKNNSNVIKKDIGQTNMVPTTIKRTYITLLIKYKYDRYHQSQSPPTEEFDRKKRKMIGLIIIYNIPQDSYVIFSYAAKQAEQKSRTAKWTKFKCYQLNNFAL